ncbi:hypothetical protein D9M71_375710 [compost metagenome]
MLLQCPQLTGIGTPVVVAIDPHFQLRPDGVFNVDDAIGVGVNTCQGGEAILERRFTRAAITACLAAVVFGEQLADVAHLAGTVVMHQHAAQPVCPAGAAQ